MIDLLIGTLEGLKIGEVWEQGGVPADKEYPKQFLTFWNTGSLSAKFYDNGELETIWKFEVNYYTDDRRTLIPGMKIMIKALKEAGFIISGQGHQVASDQQTHTGRGISARYIEREVE